MRAMVVVIVIKYDRLARPLKYLLEIVETIREYGADFRSLAADIDTTTPVGRLVFHVFASVAQFEQERISERTREGFASARKRGRIGGALTTAQKTKCAECVTMNSAPSRRSRGCSRSASGWCGELSGVECG